MIAQNDGDEEAMPETYRRWDDYLRELDVRVPAAIAQAMTPWRLVHDELLRDVKQLKDVVFGNPPLGLRGMVERMVALETKIDTLIDGQQQREEDWKQMRAFLGHEKERQAVQQAIKRGVGLFNVVVGIFAGVMTILTLLQLFHIISL